MYWGDMVLPANGVPTHRHMHSRLLWPLTGSPGQVTGCAVNEGPSLLCSLRHAQAHGNTSVGREESTAANHLVVQPEARGGADEHAGHLLGRGEAVQLLNAVMVGLPDGLVVGAPVAQQLEKGALCAVAHQLSGLALVHHQEGLQVVGA